MRQKKSVFGVYLKKLRKNKKGFRQKELCEKFGFSSVQAISNWESGRFLPEPNKLSVIKRVLNLDGGEYATLLAYYQQAKRGRDFGNLAFKNLPEKVKGELDRYGTNLVPLYLPTDLKDPADLKSSEEWRGKKIDILPDLQGKRVFAFQVRDASMSPRYSPGDILFCDIERRLEEGKVVVACTQGRVVVRLLEKRGVLTVFKALKAAEKSIIVKGNQVAWCFAVIRRVSNET